MAVDIAGAATAAVSDSGNSGSGGASSTGTGTPQTAPTSTPASSPSQGGSGGVSGGAGGAQTPAVGSGASPANSQGVAGAAAGAGQGDGWMGIRDAARQYGYDLGNVADDHAALQQLILRAQQSQQLQQMAQYGQLYLQHADQFQRWQREQQESAQRQQQQAAQWFKAPEWDANWRNLITRDPQTGEYKPAPGAPPDIVQKYLTGLQHQQSFLERFAFDPIGAIKPGLEQMVQQIAGQIAQQQLGGYRDQTFAQGFIQQNSPWLYQQDQNGQQIRGMDGRPVLSQWGQAFRGYVAEAAQSGIGNEEMRAKYAMSMVQRDFLAYQQQLSQQQPAGDAAKQQFIQQAQAAQAAQFPAPQQQPLVNGAQIAQAGRGRTPKVPLSERIKRNFAAAGISDQALTAKAPAR